MKRTALAIGGALVLAFPAWQQRHRLLASRPEAEWSECRVERVMLGSVLTERGWLVSLATEPVTIGASGEIAEITATGTPVRRGDVVIRLDDSTVRERLTEEDYGLYDAEQELASYLATLEFTQFQQEQTLSDLRRRLVCAQLEEETARVGLTESERRQLEIELETAKLDRLDAEEEYQRQRRLFDRGFISAAMLEPYERQVEARRATAAEVEARIRLEAKGVAPELLVELQRKRERIEAQLARGERATERRIEEVRKQIVVSEYHVDRHRQQKQEIEAELAATTVPAPRDGVMAVRLHYGRGGTGWTEYRPGIQRWRGDRLADIIDLGRMRIDMMIHEADVGSVRPGMAARIRIPAQPGKVFHGQVTDIGGVGRDRADVAPMGYESGRSGVTMFNASVTIDAAGAELRPGMSAVVDIILEEPRPRLVLPRESVRDADSGFRVTRRQGRHVVQQPVKGRFLGEGYFEVEDGLREGDLVLAAAAPAAAEATP